MRQASEDCTSKDYIFPRRALLSAPGGPKEDGEGLRLRSLSGDGQNR
jgi:hypothetical protein